MKDKKSFTIELKPAKQRVGHMTHRSGSGTHDNRPKRERTRRAQIRKAIQEYS